MLDIEVFKKSIEDKTVSIDFVIFRYTDNSFLPYQYLHEISRILNLEINYVDSLESITKSNSFFDIDDSNISTHLNVLSVKELTIPIGFRPQVPSIIICNKIDKDTEKQFEDKILVFPKIEDWQIKDYVYSIAEGIDEKKLDNLIAICKNDIFRIDSELSKIKLFGINERKFVFDKFIDDGIFSDLSSHTIFDFTNAILKKDIKALTMLYKEIENIDCEPLGVVSTLYKSLKNIIAIQFLSNATPESTGLQANRFWAIKKNNCGFYTKEQLMLFFDMLVDIDRKLKSGELDSNIIIDYVVCHALSY